MRKTTIVFLSMVLGIVISRIFTEIILIIIFSLLLVVLFYCFKDKYQNMPLFIICLFAFYYSSFYSHYLLYKLSAQEKLHNTIITKYVKVVSFPEENESYKSFYAIVNINNKNEKIFVKTYSKKKIYYNDIVKISGKLKIPAKATNFRGFDYQQYLKSHKTLYTIFSEDVKIIKSGSGIFNFINKISLRFQETFIKSFSPLVSALLNGLLFGIKGFLPDDTYIDFQRVGLAHLLAASGGNIAVICVAIELLFKKILRMYGRYVNIIICIAIIFYCIIAGMSSSIVRATIMALILYTGKILYKNADSINSLSIAGILILLVNPLMFFNIGFQLSFLCVFSILLFYKWFYKNIQKYIRIKWLNASLSLSISSQVLIIPLLIYHFHEVSIISIFTNIIAAFISSLIIPIGFIFLFLKLINIDVFLLKALLNILATSFLKLAELSHLPFAYVKIIYWNIVILISYYIFILLFLIKNKAIKKLAAILIFTIIFGSFTYYFIDSKNLFIAVIDVGQGDSSIIRFRGYTILIDTGPETEGYIATKSCIVPYLLHRGINKIDVLILTHQHDDHCGGLIYLFDNIKVEKIFTTIETQKEKHAILKNQKVYIVSKPIKLHFGEMTILLFNPIDEDDNKSIVAKLSLEDFNMLFTGDISKTSEKFFINNNLINSEVLKVAHHGSSSSTSEDFLDAVKPKVAIISVGRDNRFGHPSNEVLERLKDRGIMIFRTDLNGEVNIKYDGKKAIFKTFMR